MKNLNCALHSVAALVMASLAAACSNDDGLEGNTSGIQETVTLTAWQPGSESETRVCFDSNGKAYWQKGDAIGVIPSGGTIFSSFSLVSGVGTAKASFRGTVTGGVGKYSVYPCNEKHRLTSNTLYYYLPEGYSYESVEKTFFPEGKDGKNFNMPMYGTIVNGKVSFKNIGGVICLLVDKMPAASGTVTVTEASNQLCGRFSTSLTDATPEIKTKASYSNNSVTFYFSNAAEGEPGVFHLPVATGTYNLTVKVESTDKVSTTTVDAVTITRSKLQAVKVTTDYPENPAPNPAPVVINGHNFIDLGLPSGILWAETNIGAKIAADDGDYFAWGETTVKDNYCWGNYALGTAMDDIIKYNYEDGLYTLEATDDAAYVNWGERLPYTYYAGMCRTRPP